MIYRIKSRCLAKIARFYRNVSKKYKHTYSDYLMHKNMEDATNAMFLIERTLLRRRPTIPRWQQEGWHMATAGHWCYAYTIEDDTVIIQDACHEQNMHE